MTEHKQLQSYRCHWLTGLFLSLISCIHFPHMACCSFPDTRYSSGVATLCILTLFSWVLIGFHAATGLWPGASWQGFIDEQQMLWPKTPAVLLEQGGKLISPRTSFCFWIHPRAQRDASLLLFMQIKRSEVSFSVSLSARTPFFFSSSSSPACSLFSKSIKVPSDFFTRRKWIMFSGDLGVADLLRRCGELTTRPSLVPRRL